MIRVVLADDHSLVRSGLEQLLKGDAEIEVVGMAADGAQAVEPTTSISASPLSSCSRPLLHERVVVGQHDSDHGVGTSNLTLVP